MHTRRNFLAVSTGLCGLALAGCAVTNTNGVTTVTLNLADINAWGQAIANAGKLLAPLTGPAGATISNVVTAAESDLASVTKLAGGSVTLTFDTTSVPAAVNSLLGDGQQIITDVSGAVSASLTSTAQTYVTALQTVVSVFEAALGFVSAVNTGMTEAQALGALGVKK